MHSRQVIDPIQALAQSEAVKAQFESAMTRARTHSAMLSVLCVDLADLRVEVAVKPEWDDNPTPARLAGILRRCARRNDLVAPLNDEVCVIVAEFMDSPHAARRMADRILSALQLPLAGCAAGAKRGARIGIATASGAQLEGEHPLRRAHRAMLRARLDGGDRGIVADAI